MRPSEVLSTVFPEDQLNVKPVRHGFEDYSDFGTAEDNSGANIFRLGEIVAGGLSLEAPIVVGADEPLGLERPEGGGVSADIEECLNVVYPKAAIDPVSRAMMRRNRLALTHRMI